MMMTVMKMMRMMMMMMMMMIGSTPNIDPSNQGHQFRPIPWKTFLQERGWPSFFFNDQNETKNTVVLYSNGDDFWKCIKRDSRRTYLGGTDIQPNSSWKVSSFYVLWNFVLKNFEKCFVLHVFLLSLMDHHATYISYLEPVSLPFCCGKGIPVLSLQSK